MSDLSYWLARIPDIIPHLGASPCNKEERSSNIRSAPAFKAFVYRLACRRSPLEIQSVPIRSVLLDFASSQVLRASTLVNKAAIK